MPVASMLLVFTPPKRFDVDVAVSEPIISVPIVAPDEVSVPLTFEVVALVVLAYRVFI